MEQQDLLQQIKIRLLIDEEDTSKDAVLLSYLSEIQEKVKSYCNRKTIPERLQFILIRMTVELYGISDRNDRKVKSETQGSRTLQYAGVDDVDSIVSSFALELNRYRRITAI